MTSSGCREVGALPWEELGLSGASQRRRFRALAAGSAALAVGRNSARGCWGTQGTWQLKRLVLGCTAMPGGGVGGSLMEPVWVSFPQAAELVSKNWEAYEAHMRDVRDYLEARLEVSRPAPCLSLPSRGLSLQSTGPGYLPLALPPHHQLSGSQPSDFSRPPLGSRGSTSTATSRAPSDSATPLTSPSWALAFKVALTTPLPRDGVQAPVQHSPLRRETSRRWDAARAGR